MSVPTTARTPKGTELPLLNLKGKPYLMGGYRLVWLNEAHDNFEINTEFLLITDEQTVARASVKLLDKDGKVLKSATATKRETKKDFPDHTEKAESSAIFRALAMLGMGTQFALTDLDEGNRLADSPLNPVSIKATAEAAAQEVKAEKKSTFRKPAPAAAKPAESEADGWEN
jgi:hypothetical protein